MTVLPIILAPDPILKTKAMPVQTVDPEISQLMKDMLETMYLAPGIGLAATQIGVLKRVVVIDISKKDQLNEPICMANPEIVWSSEEKVTREEGCLSLPEQYGEITRPNRIKLRYIDENNEKIVREASGLLATCIQHELDHLQGILFIDHLSSLKRNIILRRLKKLKKINVKDKISKSH